MRLRCLLLVAAVLAAPATRAEIFTNPSGGYAFEAPDSWQLAHPDFMLTSRSGASLYESSLPPGGERSLRKISTSAGMIACIGANYEDTHEQFALSGLDWNGLVRVFVEPRRLHRQPRHVLQLVAQHGDNFHLFYLAVPTREWLSDRVPFTTLLRTLHFLQPPTQGGRAPAPAPPLQSARRPTSDPEP